MHKLPKVLKNYWLETLYFSGWTAYFFYFWLQAITYDVAGNLMAGHVNIWGDWAAHFTMGSAMAERSLSLSTSPFLITAPFSYPFAANLISALLIRLGVPFFAAFTGPSFIASITIIFALYIFYTVLFKKKITAILASLIFLLNGGIGIYYFIQDTLNSQDPWQTLINPPLTYTNIEPMLIRWISVIDSMIIPQRSFGLGFPLAVLVLAWVYRHLIEKKSYKSWQLVLVGILLGIMPIIHTHSFLVLFIILSIWMIASLWKQPLPERQMVKPWLSLAGITALLSLPLYLLFFSQNTGAGFFQWQPGWYVTDSLTGWVIFWFKNWLLTPVIALIGYLIHVLRQKNSQERVAAAILYSPFFILFILLNLVIFQPFIWDNTKILVWVSLGFSGLTAYAFVEWWNRQEHQNIFTRIVKKILRKNSTPMRKVAQRVAIVVFFLVTIATGSIDAYRILRHDLHRYQLYSVEELQLANWTRKNTSADSVWLTGENHNHWLFNLTGRQSLLTYRGWLWTHGYDYLEVEQDATALFANPNRQDLIEKYGIDYAVIGENETVVWRVNKAAFDQQFTIAVETSNYTVYELTSDRTSE